MHGLRREGRERRSGLAHTGIRGGHGVTHTLTHTHGFAGWLVGCLGRSGLLCCRAGLGTMTTSIRAFAMTLLKSSNQIIIATFRASVHLCFDPTMTPSYHLQRRDAVNTKPTGISTTPIAGHSREQVRSEQRTISKKDPCLEYIRGSPAGPQTWSRQAPKQSSLPFCPALDPPSSSSSSPLTLQTCPQKAQQSRPPTHRTKRSKEGPSVCSNPTPGHQREHGAQS